MTAPASLEIVRTPDFQYSGFYFPEIAARLRRFMRAHAPEITNEDLREPFMQLERAFALMAHYNNVLLDMVANEIFIATARHPESVKYQLGLIDYKMLPASPGQLEVLCKMARTYATAVRILEANRKFATQRNEDEPEIVFENTSPLDLTARTDRVELAYGMVKEQDGTCFTSSVDPDIIEVSAGYQFVTADLHKVIEVTGSILGNNIEDAMIEELLEETAPGSGIWKRARLTGSSFVSETALSVVMRGPTSNGGPDLATGVGFVPFAAPPVAGDKFYIGHTDIMWDRIDIVMAAAALGVEGVWEFYDDSETTVQPDSVVVDPVPGYLRFYLNSLLGITSDKGAHVKVQHVPTGYESTAIVQFAVGQNYVDVSGYMGQVIPSDDAGDYLVFCEWRPIDITQITTGTGLQRLAQSGLVKFDIPQSTSDRWARYQIYDITAGSQMESYFLRYRVLDNSGGAIGPSLTSLSIAVGDQYILFDATQGKTVEDDPLGSSSGEQSQEFVLTRKPYIMNSIRVLVDEGGGLVEWTETDSFLTSYATDRHFVVDVQTDGSAYVVFGDGTNGRIPPIGTNNIVAIYRIGADDNGNVGNGVLTVNRDGVGVFRDVTNPRAGAFWVEADWASVESLEQVKRRGPHSLRTMYRSVTPSDAEILARSFVNRDGVRPVARARAYEESFGPKTVEIVVAGRGGAALKQSYRTQLEEYFNGGEVYKGVLLMNYEATITNYTPRLIGLNVEVTASGNVTRAMVIQVLSYLLSPTALERDGVSYVWQFGQEVPLSRVGAEIFSISPGNVFKVKFTSPTADISLNANELPVFDPITTNVVMLQPNRN